LSDGGVSFTGSRTLSTTTVRAVTPLTSTGVPMLRMSG
jgi:hypothetical protein